MDNEIKIRARKISDIPENVSFDFETKGNDAFLLVAYKPTNGESAQNFRISIKAIIDILKDSLENMTNDEFRAQLLDVLQQYDDVKNILVTKSILDWAHEHGFTGSDDELWQLFQNNENSTSDDQTPYLFTYASELQEDIFIKDINNNIIDVNVDALKALPYTQEVTDEKFPTTNKNGHGFCLQDYNTTFNESYVWDNVVENGRVWIILPSKFYDMSQNNFIDENGGKWKFVDHIMKNPINPAVDPIIISLYKYQDYILVCFSEEGQVDEQYFKKIG